MPVYKDAKRGTWYISYQQKDAVTGKSKTTKKRGFKTRREAIAAEKDLILSPERTSSITVRELIPIWEDQEEASTETRNRHKEHFTIRLGQVLDMPIESLSRPFLSRLRADLAQDDRFSTKTKNLAISYLKSLLKYANDVYGIPTNYTALKPLKKTDDEIIEESKKGMNVWTVDEFNQFITYIDHPVYNAFFRFLFWTGCRRGEAIALQKEDVHDKTVTFRYSQRLKREGLKPTKTKITRTIAIDDDTWSRITSLQSEGTYLFGGTGLAPNPITYWFKKGIEQSGVKPIRVHDLRHSHATWLINNGVNVVAVSKRLGHKDITTTLNVYTHLLQSTDNDMMNKINHATIMPR